MKYIGTYNCGYVSCEETICLIANSITEAEEYMKDRFVEYMCSWEYLAMEEYQSEMTDENGDFLEDIEGFYESNIYDNFMADGSWSVREATEIDLANYDDTWWTDIR